MPEATPFQTLGVGNGFPFCPEKVNVLDNVGDGSGSEYDYWTTLGGFNKNSGGNPTDAQIHDSRVAAMRLYWNAYALKSVVSGSGAPASSIGSIDAANDKIYGKEFPRERVCSEYGLGMLDALLYDDNEAFYEVLSYSIMTNTCLVRMYDGVTTDEDNFVGFGVTSEALDDVVNYGNGTGMSAYIDEEGGVIISLYLCSYADDPDPSLATYDAVDLAYASVNGLHLLSTAIVGFGNNVSTNAANLTATSDNGVGDPVTLTFKDGSGDTLEFYTYP